MSLGLRATGANHKLMKAHISRLGLDISHFGLNFSGLRAYNLVQASRKQPNEEIFRKGNTTIGSRLRRRAIKDGRLPYMCVKCDNPGIHQGSPLTLHLDHIDGDHSNCEWSNLRWLCPNCHSQTPTYARTANRKKMLSRHVCTFCSASFERESSRTKAKRLFCSKACSDRRDESKNRKVDREEVLRMFQELGNRSEVARRLGVSNPLVGQIVRGVLLP